jgi:hypothetical protein
LCAAHPKRWLMSILMIVVSPIQGMEDKFCRSACSTYTKLLLEDGAMVKGVCVREYLSSVAGQEEE